MLLLFFSAMADTYEDDFRTDQGRWSGGFVATTNGTLEVTDGVAELPLPGVASFSGRLLVRLRSGTRIAVGAGDATWSATYDADGGVFLGESALPLPTGPYTWEPDVLVCWLEPRAGNRAEIDALAGALTFTFLAA